MSNTIPFIFLAILVIACNQNAKSPEDPGTQLTQDSTIKVTDDILCFRKVSGRNNKDTTIVNLIIEGNKVTGEMVDKIWEKDSRKGRLSGSIEDNNIKTVYYFVQEGISDSLNLEFKLADGALLQKPITNGMDGRQVPNPSDQYDIKLDKIECKKSI